MYPCVGSRGKSARAHCGEGPLLFKERMAGTADCLAEMARSSDWANFVGRLANHKYRAVPMELLSLVYSLSNTAS